MLSLDYLTLKEKFAIVRTLLHLRWRVSANGDGKTAFSEYLKSRNVPSRVQELFFKPVVVSALSIGMDRASLASARKVFVDAFMKSRHGYELFVPRHPISGILELRAIPWLAEHGVQIHRAMIVKQIVIEQNRVRRIQLAGSKMEEHFINAENVVVAVPWMNVGDLFEPSICTTIPEVEKLAHLEAAPIVSVHLWFDRAIIEQPHLVLPGRLSQWLFASSEQDANSHRYQVIISAAYDEAKMPREELTQIVLCKLKEILPMVQAASLLRSQVIVQSRAVFAPTPGHERFRPEAKASTVRGLYFAGDWTATGWPATMESAVRSGLNAAQSIVANL
jgi:squalene-associated FAD-dependent desaturase